ncbi:McrC family protein [Lolliginicoccus levis]|uniref:McrC family protein n=1 Tax=Lolliginicoccus levis TaxID=2919542 RepID=UPI00241CC293|nr:restriction endonuclease [Lolliginicoccus levis]
MRTLTLTEGGPPQQHQLTRIEYEALATIRAVEIHPTLETGWYVIAASSKVGAISIGDLQVIVQPKITDINRLIFLLGYAQNPRIWRDDHVTLDADTDLFPALAESFSRITTKALDQGLLQGYKTIRDTLPVLRGRVLAGEQMTQRFGSPLPLHVEYDEFTVDIAENRILLAATTRLLRIPAISHLARRTLIRLQRTLSDVTEPVRGQKLPHWQPSRLNARYHTALALADIVLRAESFEHRIGDLTVTGFMFDMWRIFEDFTTIALRETFKASGGTSHLQHRMTLDNDRAVTMKPDFVWFGDDATTIVIDSKYKAEKPAGFPDADLYQMLAYCTVLDVRDGHLIYAKGNTEPTVHTVRRSGVRIHCHALDLAAEPSRLLRQIVDLRETMQAFTTEAQP